jgi:hypothetical protein
MDYTQILDDITKRARDPKKMSLDLKTKLFKTLKGTTKTIVNKAH